MILDYLVNCKYIEAHLATPLALAYTSAVIKDYHKSIRYLLLYIQYGGEPHNLVPDSGEYFELKRLIGYYAQVGPSELATSPYYEDESTLGILKAIYKILEGAEKNEQTSDFIKYYVEAKHQIQ